MNRSLDELRELYIKLDEFNHYTDLYFCAILFPEDMYHKTTNGKDFTMDINTIMPAKFETNVQGITNDTRDSRDRVVFHYDSSKMTVICSQCITNPKDDELTVFFTLKSANGNYFKHVDIIKHLAGVLNETRTYVCNIRMESAISYYFADNTQHRMTVEEAFGVTVKEG